MWAPALLDVEAPSELGVTAWQLAGLLLVALTAADGMFKHFKSVRLLWKGALTVGTYLRDLFMGPIKVRRIEDRMRASGPVDPVYHLGMVWFPSEAVEGRFEPFCQYCWANEKKIALDCHVSKENGVVYCACRAEPGHGRDSGGYPPRPTIEDFEHARVHVWDRRKAIGR